MKKPFVRPTGQVLGFGTIVMTLLFITGCPAVKWEQPGRTQVQVEEDSFACENMLEKEKNWDKLTDKERDALREQCMMQKGYQKRTAR